MSGQIQLLGHRWLIPAAGQPQGALEGFSRSGQEQPLGGSGSPQHREREVWAQDRGRATERAELPVFPREPAGRSRLLEHCVKHPPHRTSPSAPAHPFLSHCSPCSPSPPLPHLTATLPGTLLAASWLRPSKPFSRAEDGAGPSSRCPDFWEDDGG